MLPKGAQPMHKGVTRNVVLPKARKGRKVGIAVPSPLLLGGGLGVGALRPPPIAALMAGLATTPSLYECAGCSIMRVGSTVLPYSELPHTCTNCTMNAGS